MKSFGGTPRGARLERIKASPRWAGERFRNVHPIIPGLRDPNASMPTLGEFLCDGARRTPRGPLPSMNPLEAKFSKRDRKSTRLNSSHGSISYAVFCLKKKTSKNSAGQQ